MPNVNIPKYPLSLLDESCKFMVMSQQMYAHKLGIPWFWIGSANVFVEYLFSQSQLDLLVLLLTQVGHSMSRLNDFLLAVTDYPKEVVNNLKRLQECGMFQKYGYYEAVDFTPTRLRKNRAYELVKTYMAHFGLQVR